MFIDEAGDKRPRRSLQWLQTLLEMTGEVADRRLGQMAVLLQRIEPLDDLFRQVDAVTAAMPALHLRESSRGSGPARTCSMIGSTLVWKFEQLVVQRPRST
jgi:hypothetical protein